MGLEDGERKPCCFDIFLTGKIQFGTIEEHSDEESFLPTPDPCIKRKKLHGKEERNKCNWKAVEDLVG